ncbi:MAG: hypothetical protein HWE10_14360 [Gammaproteobacteria bacterium]|nr:hypothetical protein [Gammaproteobacteria bacterium]
MFNSKLTKVALALALSASAAAHAANDLTLVATTDVADGTNTVAAVEDLTFAKELSATTATNSHAFANAAVTANFITYEASGTGIPNDGFITFTFTNGGITDSGTLDLTRQVTPGTDNDEESVGSIFSKVTNADGYLSSVTFQVSSTIDLGDVLILQSNAAGGDDNTFDGTPAVFRAARNLAKDDVISVAVTTKTPSLVDFADGAASALTIVTAADGYTSTAITSVESSVDFAGGGTDFLTTNTSSEATDLGIAAAALSEPLVLDANDTVTISVTTDTCEAVDDDLASVQFGQTAQDATSKDYDTCTWTFAGAANATAGADAVAGTADIEIIVNDEDDITSTDWTYTVSVEDELGNDSELLSGTSHEWIAQVQGSNAYVPYMYHVNASGWFSQAKLANLASEEVDVAATVTLKDMTAGTDAVVYTDYKVATIAANDIAQLTGTQIVEALITPTGDALKGYNTTAVDLDTTHTYHMSVKFTFDGAADEDQFEVSLQNVSPTGRANGQVYYGSGRSID